MAFTEMYGFETKDGQQARVDLSQIRSVLPSGSASGYVKVVLDGGNSVTVKGTVDGVYDLIVHYCGKRTAVGVGTGVGFRYSVPVTGNGLDEEAVAAAYLRGSLPKESDESIALRDIANLLGFIGPPDSPQTVVKAAKERLSAYPNPLRTRDRTLQQAIQLVAKVKTLEEAEDILHKMLTGAIPAPKAQTTEDDSGQQFNAVHKRVSLDGKSVGAIAGGVVGETIGAVAPHASRGTSDAYQRLGARLVSLIPDSLRRMTYDRPNDAWQTESPRSLLKRISEETDHVLSCMLSGQYTDDVWSQLADVVAAAFLVGDSYEAKRWAPTSADGSGL